MVLIKYERYAVFSPYLSVRFKPNELSLFINRMDPFQILQLFVPFLKFIEVLEESSVSKQWLSTAF